MTQSASVWSALADIFVDPKKVFRATDGQKGWTLVPLFWIILVPFLVQFYYFSTVDMNWLVDHILAASGKEVPEEARKFMTRTTMMIGAAVSQLVVGPILVAVYSLYLHLVAKMSSNADRSYGSWFCLSVWSSMPAVIMALSSLIYYATSGTTQMGPEELNFFSANALIAHIPAGKPGATLMEAITPFIFWGIILTALGLQVWTKRTFAKALMVAAAPYVVVFGLWAILAFR